MNQLVKNPVGQYAGTTFPLLGRIAPGHPIETISDSRQLDFWQRVDVPNLYQLQISGNSMMGAGIFDGDTILMQSTGIAPNGAIVVALVDGYNATLRRYYRRKDKVILTSENPDHPAQHFAYNRIQIQGVLFCLTRFYQ